MPEAKDNFQIELEGVIMKDGRPKVRQRTEYYDMDGENVVNFEEEYLGFFQRLLHSVSNWKKKRDKSED